MSTFSRLVSVVRYLVLVRRGSVARGFGGSGAPPAGLVDGWGASPRERALASLAGNKAGRRALGRSRRGLLLVVLSCGALLGVGAAPAFAGYQHDYLSQLTGFSNAYSVAVDDQSSDTLVADSGPDVVDVYDVSGNQLPTWDGSAAANPPGTPAALAGKLGFGGGQVAVAANNTTGDVYVTDSSDAVVDILSSSGGYLGQLSDAAGTAPFSFASPQGVAVDQATGNIYVADPGAGLVDVFDSAGAFTGTLTGQSFGNAYSVAVDDHTGQVLVADSLSDVVYVFDAATGAFTGTTWDGSAAANPPGTPAALAGNAGFGRGQVTVAADNATGDVYVTDNWDGVVDELDGSGSYLDQLTGTPSGGFGNAQGVAVDQATGDVYVGDTGNGVVDIFGPTLLLPDVTTGQATGVGTTGASLSGTVNPDGTTLNSSGGCQFEYVDATHYNPNAPDPYSAGQSAPCSPPTPSGSSPVPVTVQLSGLSEATTYHFRLEASNSEGTSVGSDQTFTTLGPPTVDSESPNGATGSSVTLNAQINPNGFDTTYHFEYGPGTSYGTSVPVPDADIGSGTGEASVSQTISGLSAATDYHFRVVATNSQGTVDGPDRLLETTASAAPLGANSIDCPNAQYRTGPSADLPDCRAWEQVSPVDKNGLDTINSNSMGWPAEAALDGNSLMYQSTNSYANAQGSTLPNVYLATRTASGWQTDNVTAPSPDTGAPGVFTADYDFSPDLSQAVYGLANEQLAPNAAPDVENLFLRQSDGSFSTITNTPRPVGCPSDNPYGPQCWQLVSRTLYAGASTDYSHIIFESNDCLTADAPCGVWNLYENVNGQVSFVGYLPDGTADSNGSQPGSGDAFALTTAAGAVDVANAISSDGSRVFFDAGADGGAPDPAQNGLTELYERVNGSSTVEVSAPASGAAPANSAPEPATYWGASSDGSEVFFTSSAELTTDANTGSGNAGNDLYEFNTGTGVLTDLTVDSNPADASTGANVQGVVGTSSDGSYVYFVADGQLVSGQGVDGEPNLYLDHAGQTTFIATLSPNDSSDWTNQRMSLRAYVTPDGQHLAFMSTLPLTGYHNTDQNTGQPDSEVYEYSAASGLICASCDPTGAEPVGNAFIGTTDKGGDATLGKTPFYQPRALSDDGSRLFFSSPDALTPGATSSYTKVYEYENGAVALLGAATTGNDFFLDAPPSGDDAFIATSDQLVASDQDRLVDVYDARVDGGFAPSSTPVQCQGDSCQGQPPPPPPLPVAGSVTFTGPGNPSSTVTTGKVKITGKAVKGSRFVLDVRVTAAGRVTVRGADTRALSRWLARAGTYRITISLTKRAERTLKRRHRIRVRVRLAYAPRAGGRSTAAAAITVKR